MDCEICVTNTSLSFELALRCGQESGVHCSEEVGEGRDLSTNMVFSEIWHGFPRWQVSSHLVRVQPSKLDGLALLVSVWARGHLGR